MKGKQRYKCEYCGCNYIGSKNGYPNHIKLKAIKYYLEGNGFRKSERLMVVSHLSVINNGRFKNLFGIIQDIIFHDQPP